jgi:hypothetical protein
MEIGLREWVSKSQMKIKERELRELSEIACASMGRQELVTPSAGNIRALLLEKGIDRNEKQRRVVLN